MKKDIAMFELNDVKALMALANKGCVSNVPEERLKKMSSRPIAYWIKRGAYVCVSASIYGKWYSMTEDAKQAIMGEAARR